MKKLTTLFILWLSLHSAIALADMEHNQPEIKALPNYALIQGQNLPHLMKPLMRFKEQLQLTNEQQQALKKLRQEMAPQIHQGLQQAKQLEQQLAQEILQDQKTATDLEKGLLKLQQQKWNNTQKLINALAQIRQILTPEQYQELLQLSGH